MQKKPLPTPTQIVPPVDQAHYTFFGPMGERPAFEAVPINVPLWPNAWWLSDFSMLAYGDRAYITKGLDSSGFEVQAEHYFDIDATKCFIAASNDAIVVSFCGTELPQFKSGAKLDLTHALLGLAATWSTLTTTLFDTTIASANDWLRNAQIDQVEYATHNQSLGNVHTGFLNGFAAIKKPVQDALAELLIKKIRPIWFTGHSLGGAIATLAAASFNKLCGLYTYGTPRVGDAEFVNKFPAQILVQRFCTLGDPVPLVPTHAPGIPFFAPEYRHAGNAYWLSKDSAPQKLSTTEIPAVLVNPLHHAPMRYSNLIWNSMVG